MQYLDGELDADTRTTFDYHLSRCRNCVGYVEQYRRTIVEGRAAFAEDEVVPPGEMPEELVRAILAARRRG
jgi:anti-sigma factor RsiW